MDEKKQQSYWALKLVGAFTAIYLWTKTYSENQKIPGIYDQNAEGLLTFAPGIMWLVVGAFGWVVATQIIKLIKK